MSGKSIRNEVISYTEKHYKCNAEYPWRKFPDYAVMRHSENQKWFALFMTISMDKLGMNCKDYIDILNVKVEQMFDEILIQQKGFFPAYHQKRGSGWITILLDGTVKIEEIKNLLEMSFNLTLPKNKIKNPSYRNTKWIVPANPKYYDIDQAIRESADRTFIWKQSNRILAGDTVFLYVAAPISAIKYKCEVVEADIPYEYSDENVSMSRVMKLKVLRQYDNQPIDYSMLCEYGVKAIRGPRNMPARLEEAIEVMYS